MPKIVFRLSEADVVYTESTEWGASEGFLAACLRGSLTPSDLPLVGFVLFLCAAPHLGCCFSMSVLCAVKSPSYVWFPSEGVISCSPSFLTFYPCGEIMQLSTPPKILRGQARSTQLGVGQLKDHIGAAGSGLGDSADGHPPAGSALSRCLSATGEGNVCLDILQTKCKVGTLTTLFPKDPMNLCCRNENWSILSGVWCGQRNVITSSNLGKVYFLKICNSFPAFPPEFLR